MKAERNYSVDLLKCISMLMVVVLHLNNYGLRNVAYNHFGLIGLSSTLLQSFSIVGVNVFVLITGYFLSGSRVEFSKKGLLGRYKRLLPLWIQVELYSVGVYLVLCAIPQSGVRFGFRQLITRRILERCFTSNCLKNGSNTVFPCPLAAQTTVFVSWLTMTVMYLCPFLYEVSSMPIFTKLSSG